MDGVGHPPADREAPARLEEDRIRSGARDRGQLVAITGGERALDAAGRREALGLGARVRDPRVERVTRGTKSGGEPRVGPLHAVVAQRPVDGEGHAEDRRRRENRGDGGLAGRSAAPGCHSKQDPSRPL